MKIAVYALGVSIIATLGLAACGGSQEPAAPAGGDAAAAHDQELAGPGVSDELEEEIVEAEVLDTPSPEAETAADDAAMTLQTQDMRMQMGDGVVRMETDEATVTLQSGEDAVLPDDFPADVPLLEDMKLTSVMQQTGTDEAVLVTASTSMPLQDAAQTIAENAAANGWTEVTRVNQAGQMAVLAYEKDGRSWNATVVREDGMTLMNWAVSK